MFCVIYSGWQRWLQGIASYARADGNGKIIHAPVKPIRLLSTATSQSRLGGHTTIIGRLSWNCWREKLNKRYAIDTSMEKYPVFATAKNTWKVSTYVRKMREVDCRRKREAMVV